MLLAFFLAGLLALAAGGAAAWLLRREAAGLAGAVLGPLLALPAPLHVLLSGETLSLSMPWSAPYGSFSLSIDPLAAFFLLPALGLTVLAALYGFEYLGPYRGAKDLGAAWLFYNALAAAIALVLCAANGVLFLLAWEAMALASFFLVVFESEKPEVLDAGWSYLVAGHLGAAFLLALFLQLGRSAPSLDFSLFARPGTKEAGLLFVLALLGFGTKAGFFPLHVWLPEAHPAAPSHVSALMSGVMIKTGIYGLLRFYLLLGPGPAWWGGLVLGVGAASAILGILFALAQRDLKRLLAYSSVENVGIIALGLGLGMLGGARGDPVLAALGFGGGLLHALNHGLFKTLLFLGAGSVLHASGTRRIDQLGGLLKRMPQSASCFLLGSAAVSGLPPLNGFAGEFLILLAAYRALIRLGSAAALPAAVAVASMALVSGLALACFAKAAGVVLLGEPRSERARRAHEPGRLMRWPMLALALACVALGLGAAPLLEALRPVLDTLAGGGAEEAAALASPALRSLALLGLALAAACAALAALRSRLLAGRPVERAPTWDCGYAWPSPRMQYTGSSFSQPLTSFFGGALGLRVRFTSPSALYPTAVEFSTSAPDAARARFFEPASRRLRGALAKLRWLQHGHPQLYVLYIAITLVALLLWKLG